MLKNTNPNEAIDTQSAISSVVLKINLVNKKFSGQTLIYPSYCEKPPDLIETQLEDVVFENKYNVFATNKTEVRYLVTPKFTEALNNTKTKFYKVMDYFKNA